MLFMNNNCSAKIYLKIYFAMSKENSRPMQNFKQQIEKSWEEISSHSDAETT